MTAKKYQNIYADKNNKPTAEESKRIIEAFQKKIGKLLESDPKMQKKAADIITRLIRSNK